MYQLQVTQVTEYFSNLLVLGGTRQPAFQLARAVQRSHRPNLCRALFRIAGKLLFFHREGGPTFFCSSMTEGSCIRTIVTALEAHEGILLSTQISTREVDGSFTYNAPGVIGVETSAWDQYEKSDETSKCMCCRRGFWVAPRRVQWQKMVLHRRPATTSPRAAKRWRCRRTRRSRSSARSRPTTRCSISGSARSRRTSRWV